MYRSPGSSPDWIALAGVSCGLFASVSLPFLMVRPNRILRGSPVGISEALGLGSAAILAPLFAALVFSFYRRKDSRFDAAGALCSGMGLAALLPLAGGTARLLAEGSAVVRISAGSGFWLAALGLGVALFSFQRRLPPRSPIRFACVLAAPAAAAAAALSGSLEGLSLVRELLARREAYLAGLVRHLSLAAFSALFGALAGVPIGMAMHRHPRWRPAVSALVSAAQVVPTLSLLGLLIAPMAALGASIPPLGRLGVRGVGWAPAFVVLFLYALLPIAGNTFAALGAVEPGILEAARGMGMNPRQTFRRIQAPLALPVILTGIRTAFVQNMGNTILAALVGGGGLGTLVFLGLSQAAPDLILLGGLSTAVLALVSDRILSWVIGRTISRGIRPEGI